MAWLEFSADFRWTPAKDRRVTFKFLAGKRYGVTRDCAARAIAAGVAVEVEAPPRPSAPLSPAADEITGARATAVIADEIEAAAAPPKGRRRARR